MLNLIVTAYIEMAELQAMNKTPMYMSDWVARLDDFLTKNTKRAQKTRSQKSRWILWSV